MDAIETTISLGYTIVPLGQTCDVSNLLQNCNQKTYTSLFEWFYVVNLSSVSNLLKKIHNNFPVNLYDHPEGCVCIDTYDIHSVHYSKENFVDIFERRSKRLIEQIKTSKNLLFVRVDNDFTKYTYEDIDEFSNVIKDINPTCENIKLLLITYEKVGFSHAILHNVTHNIQLNNPGGIGGCMLEPMNTLFVNSLKNIGYVFKEPIDITFNDKTTF